MTMDRLIAVTAAAARSAGADDLDEFDNLVQCAVPQFCEIPADRWPERSDAGERSRRPPPAESPTTTGTMPA